MIPEEIDQVQAIDIDLNGLRRSYLGRIADARPDRPLTTEETQFLADDTGVAVDELTGLWEEVARRPRARRA